MTHKKNGSLLLEALIALGITTFIIISTTQLTKTALRTLKEMTTLSGYMNKVIQVTNQLDKDLSVLAVLPTPVQEQATGEKNTDQKPITFASRALLAEADEKMVTKIDKKDHVTFKILSGVTTSTLQSYGEKKPYFVRFCYKLIKQTPPQPHHKKTAFKLYRRETTNIDDLNIKQDSEVKPEDMEKSSDWVLICNNIHNLVFEYSTLTLTSTLKPDNAKATADKSSNNAKTDSQSTPATDTKKQPDQLEIVSSFEWPNKKLPQETQEQTPHFITMTLQLWDDSFSKITTYKQRILCFNHSGTLPEYSLKPKSQDAQKPADSTDTKKPATQPIPSKPPTPPSSPPGQIPINPTTPPPPLPPPKKHKPKKAPLAPSQQLESGGVRTPSEPEQFYIPDDMKEVMAQFENSDIARIDPDKVLSQLPPEMAHMVQEQMKEFEKNPELLWQSMRDLFK